MGWARVCWAWPSWELVRQDSGDLGGHERRNPLSWLTEQVAGQPWACLPVRGVLELGGLSPPRADPCGSHVGL